jgi:hypothetical protein
MKVHFDNAYLYRYKPIDHFSDIDMRYLVTQEYLQLLIHKQSSHTLPSANAHTCH